MKAPVDNNDRSEQGAGKNGRVSRSAFELFPRPPFGDAARTAKTGYAGERVLRA
jgi:hypothetical protein